MRDPKWVAALVSWLASPEAKGISGRVFEAWGYGFTIAESWQHGATVEACDDPSQFGNRIYEAHEKSRKNAGIDIGQHFDP